MVQFVALYSGPDLGGAELVAISTDPGLCADVGARMLREEAETVLDEDSGRAVRVGGPGVRRSPRSGPNE